MTFTLCRGSLANRKILVDILAICFGVGAWIGINGLFVQLPLLVETQPEGWDLPSYLSVIIQVANIGPLLYSISQVLWPGKIKDSIIIYIVLTLGAITLLLMAFLYKKTNFIFGQERSTSLLSLVFFIALVGCTSSVLFMPYMGNFRDIYLISYFVGEGLSGFLPSVVALVQGVGGNPTCLNQTEPGGTETLVPYTPPPKFSTQAFFFFLFGTSVVSAFSFLLLNFLPMAKEEKVSKSKPKEANGQLNFSSIENVANPATEVSLRERRHVGNASNSDDHITNSSYNSKEETGRTHLDQNVSDNANSFSFSQSLYLLFLMAWVCSLGNGVFPSIQSYSCLPYGNKVYHLAATLGSMANPVACFMAFFLPISSILNISSLTLFSAGFSGYIIATALASPTPPLINTTSGESLIVVCWILNTGLISYVKMSIASLYRHQGGRGLFWCGALQQIGSAIGALITFFLVNYADVFTAYYPCQ